MGEYADYAVDRIINEGYGFWGGGGRRKKKKRCATVYRKPVRVIPAGKKIRLLRQRAHLSFDRLWKNGFMHRSEAYCWLARRLKLSKYEAHMGRMTDSYMLERVIRICDEYIGSTSAQDDFPDDL